MKRLYAFLIAAALCFPSIGAMAWWQSIQQVGVSSVTPGPPTVTYVGTINSVGSGASQTVTFTITPGTQYLVVLGLTLNSNPGAGGITGTITPNVGTAVSLISDDASPASNNASTYIAHGILLADANTATSVTVSYTYPGNPFKNSAGFLWVAPSAGFVSTTPTTAHATPATNTVLSTTIATSSGGFIIGVGGSTNITANSGAFSGSGLTWSTNNNSSIQSLQAVAAVTTAGVSTTGSQGVTLTYSNSAAMGFSTAAWR